jgi:hypothetical protein
MSGDKQDYNLKVDASSRIVLPADGDSTSSNGAPAGWMGGWSEECRDHREDCGERFCRASLRLHMLTDFELFVLPKKL